MFPAGVPFFPLGPAESKCVGNLNLDFGHRNVAIAAFSSYGNVDLLVDGSNIIAYLNKLLCCCKFPSPSLLSPLYPLLPW